MRGDRGRQGRFSSLWVHLWVLGEIDMSVRKRWMFISAFSLQLPARIQMARYRCTRLKSAVEQPAAISHAAAEKAETTRRGYRPKKLRRGWPSSPRWSQSSGLAPWSHDEKEGRRGRKRTRWKITRSGCGGAAEGLEGKNWWEDEMGRREWKEIRRCAGQGGRRVILSP
ncbi:hypothetical protein CCMA1212_002875 [Trichoderma ghanense]|uniref:Uncharacterized protein n=1 Tax=Trichoderma ghanense TaxID=65468 RepID=A0ABY2HD21_9HYPO